MKKYFFYYISDNIKIIFAVFLFIFVGIVFGLFTYQFLEQNIRQDLLNSIKSTLDICKQSNFEGINVIKNGIITNFVIILIIYFATITMISTYIIFAIDFFKGVLIGIYISTLFQIFDVFNGILVVLLSVIIPGIIYLLAYVYISCNAINFHYKITDRNNDFKVTVILKEMYLCLLGFSIMLFSTLIEQFLITPIINIYIKNK